MKRWLITRPFNAFLYSLAGMRTALASERAFQQEAIVFIILLVVVPSSEVDFHSAVLILLAWTVVMVAELLNSAIEACFDRISTEDHALAKIGKDLASAAVFLSILFNIGLWIAVGARYYN
ncbi:MAG: diacylglycerol kinase [Desulfovibrionaceae bacterium]|nr:diacylglycerol kinase [Desulfovibrionaceae bacterium]